MDEAKTQFLIERYKYILSRKQALNSNTFQIMTMYQTGFALVVAGQFAVAATAVASRLADIVIEGACYTLLLLIWLLTCFTVMLVISGALSWIKYRREEAELELHFIGTARPQASAKSVLTWFETYLGIVSVIASILYTAIVIFYILPIIIGGASQGSKAIHPSGAILQNVPHI